MLSVSSICCPHHELLELVALLETRGHSDVGIEIFYDVLPFFHNRNIVKELARTAGVSFHYPMAGVRLMADDFKSAAYRYSLDRLEECLETAQACCAHAVVLHAGLFGEQNGGGRSAVLRERWRERYPVWAEMAARYGVEFWVENVGMPHSGDILFDQRQYIELIEQTPGMKSLIDLGHAHGGGWDIPLVIDRLGDAVKGYHLHNNDGVYDVHWPLRQGSLDYSAVLRKVSRDALLVLEYDRAQYDSLDFIANELDWLKRMIDNIREEKQC